MSIKKLAFAVAGIVIFAGNSFAQDCGCEPEECSRWNIRRGFNGEMLRGRLAGLGFGCGEEDNDGCMTADELWAGFAENTTCTGCVQKNKLKSLFSGMRGRPACGLGGCMGEAPIRNHAQRFHSALNQSVRSVKNLSLSSFSMPSMSSNWSNPIQFGLAENTSLKPKFIDGFNLFGKGKSKEVRRDVPNDPFGRLGESQVQFQPLPTAVEEAQPEVEQLELPSQNTLPPAPVVEPLVKLDDLPSLERAKKPTYGKPEWNR